MSPETARASGHVRFEDRQAVVEALFRLGVAVGAPLPVWPPRKLPPGVFVSPARAGWVSLWSSHDDLAEWLPRLSATLECPALLLELEDDDYWTAEFYQDGDLLGRYELPTDAVEWSLLMTHAEAAGLERPWEHDPGTLGPVAAVAESDGYLEDLRRLRDERPRREALRPFLPPHGDLERAWELLTAIDRRDEARSAEDFSPFAEDYLASFAAYLGARDPLWDPRADAEALAEGDYDEEGLPEGWREFLLLPAGRLQVL